MKTTESATRESKDKLLLYKTKLKPIWTDGIELWGCSKPSNTKISQAFQSKTLRLITNAPRYVNNQTLHTDLSIPYINEVITTAARKSRDSNSNHHNPLIANLYNRPLGNRRLRRHWPEDSANSHCVDPEEGGTKCSDTQTTIYQNIRRNAGTRDLTLHHKARTNSDY
jgi:hypothetical protein